MEGIHSDIFWVGSYFIENAVLQHGTGLIKDRGMCVLLQLIALLVALIVEFA